MSSQATIIDHVGRHCNHSPCKCSWMMWVGLGKLGFSPWAQQQQQPPADKACCCQHCYRAHVDLTILCDCAWHMFLPVISSPGDVSLSIYVQHIECKVLCSDSIHLLTPSLRSSGVRWLSMCPGVLSMCELVMLVVWDIVFDIFACNRAAYCRSYLLISALLC